MIKEATYLEFCDTMEKFKEVAVGLYEASGAQEAYEAGIYEAYALCKKVFED